MLDPITIIQTVGLVGIFLIIFAESGLFFGFFLPGDSLLFTAGLFASTGFFPLTSLIVGCIIAAILGDSVGYFTGKKIGPRLFTKDSSFFFNKKHAITAEKFYKKYGSKTIVLARFIPIIRTFAPIVAGVGQMKYKKFVFFNIFSGILWPLVMILAGYYVGRYIPNAEEYLLPITLGIIFVSLAPIFLRVLFRKKHSSV